MAKDNYVFPIRESKIIYNMNTYNFEELSFKFNEMNLKKGV